MRYGFGVSRNPRGYWLTERVHKPICDLLELLGRRWLRQRALKKQGRVRFMAIIPRGFGKTVSITKSFPVWLQLHDPNLACVIDSESASKAESFLSSIKALLQGDDPHALFTWLYGDWKNPDRKWRDSEFTHALRTQTALTEPSFKTASVETGVTGLHPDFLALDDPISQERLREQGNWIQLANNHVAALTPALRTDSFFMVIGTPYTNNDVINTTLAEDGVKEAYGMTMPTSMPAPSEDGKWIVYYLQSRDPVTSESILPEAWTTQELDDYERKKPLDFAAQMQCAPGRGAHMAVSQEVIDELWVNRSECPGHMVYTIHIDTAFKHPKRMARGDETVFQVWGHDINNNTGDAYFMEGYSSNKWQVKDFMERLVAVVQRYRSQMKRIRCITDERLIGDRGTMWEDHLRSSFAAVGQSLPLLYILERGGTRKIVRMREAAGYWTDGHVRLVRKAPGVDRLVRQVMEIGADPAHDDWADCASDVFHPKVYRPMMSDYQEEPEEPVGPYDGYLKDGTITDEGGREMYDEFVDQDEEVVEWLDSVEVD